MYVCIHTFVFGDSKIMKGAKELICLLATKLRLNGTPVGRVGSYKEKQLTAWVQGSTARKKRRGQRGALGLLSVFLEKTYCVCLAHGVFNKFEQTFKNQDTLKIQISVS